MGKTKLGKGRRDKYYHLAKEQGYRSRAAFKLVQLNRTHNFLSGARSLLDLCAAPGGWCQVAVKNMPVGSLVIGVDLTPIKPIRGVKTLLGDITTQKCRQAIRKEANGSLMDVVLHDGAPNVGGAWASEAYNQSWLVLESLRMATDVLAPKGTFVTKIFRSKDYSALLYAFQQLFNKVEATKPAASRNASAEIFVVCSGYKAPAKIDPRLLDAKHLFQEVQEAPKIMGPDALIKQKIKQTRFREGYAEGLSTTHKVLSAAAFIAGDAPVEMLGQYTTIAIEGPTSEADVAGVDDAAELAAFVRGHEATTAEVKLLCKDLQVLGRSEFKQLLRWRLLVKKDLQRQQQAAAKAAAAAEGAEEGGSGEDKEEEDPEEKLLREMGDIKDRMDKRRKKERRKRREQKVKSKVRAAQLSQAEGIAEDNGPEQLFSLSKMKGKLAGDAAAPDFDEAPGTSSSSGSEGSASGSEADSEEEQRRYDEAMDGYLEDSYQAWKQRQRKKGDVVKKKRRRLNDEGELTEEEEEWEKPVVPSSESESEHEDAPLSEDEEEGGGLIVRFDERRAGVAKSADAAVSQWFSQDIFQDADVEDDEEEAVEAVLQQKRGAGKRAREPDAAAAAPLPAPRGGGGEQPPAAAVQQNGGAGSDGEADRDASSGSDAEGEPGTAAATKRQKAAGGGRVAAALALGLSADALAGPEDGFEVVPAAPSGSDGSESEDEFEAMDDYAKAEVRALAKKMLRRKVKEDIIEAAYNRYAFHDDKLPKWFDEDERRFMRPQQQVTSEEYAAAREELRAIDARPVKKVMEAKARKQKRLRMRLTQARQKAEAVSNQEDVPLKQKMREIEKIYNQAKAGKGKKGKLSRTGEYKQQKKGPKLDARMRKDRRGLEAAAKRNKGKKGAGGGVKKGPPPGKNRRR
ncbi:rRNA methyltransferase [Micractinium conductrix]|uniref:Putative rRNA methyltransferase n=1 Tax=Micractinium conductrix TaxID=554055 RepID=A0A2P6VBK7_9CHLO|nr:rRNA methyltransferase [Micractinium conductrix]|eukprot:PSC71474.1 rRNA methyltransferase [Micractinium conductrix]